MGLRARIRNEFPPRWWASKSWWITGLREFVLGLVALTATVALWPKLHRALQHPDQPRWVRDFDACLEGCIGGMVVYAAGLCAVVYFMAQERAGWIWIVVLLIVALWALSNFITALLVIAVVIRSRWTKRVEWSMRDFIEAEAPRYGRPPETPREYEADGLRRHVDE